VDCVRSRHTRDSNFEIILHACEHRRGAANAADCSEPRATACGVMQGSINAPVINTSLLVLDSARSQRAAAAMRSLTAGRQQRLLNPQLGSKLRHDIRPITRASYRWAWRAGRRADACTPPPVPRPTAAAQLEEQQAAADAPPAAAKVLWVGNIPK
jgi:hypothetical protein